MSSSTMQAGVQRLRCLLAGQGQPDESDEQLLYAFTSRRDEAAFAILVRRYGPMVLHVCRRALGHEHDAEDAFQATFLVLARNAAALRNKSSLAGFLHGIAYRTALKAKQSAARRRKHEGRTPARQSINPIDDISWREVRKLLDEEIARLPEKYRTAFVLCCLEDLSQAEAARRLGLKERTLSSQLEAARKRLSRRLRRRGVELTAVLTASMLGTQSVSALPIGLMASTIQAASAMAAGERLAGVASASVIELVQGTAASAILSKAKMAAALLLTATLLAGAGVWMCRTLAMPQTAPPLPESKAVPSHPAQAAKAGKPRQAEGDNVEVTGRVLDPDGKPAAGARVYLDPQTPGEKPMASTTTGKDGRFSLVLSRSRLVDPETKFPLQRVRILATAKGYGFDWLDVPFNDAGKEATLRLVKDDVPIQGRILSLEGKPLAGIKVSVQALQAFPRDDLDRALDAQRKGNLIADATEVHFLWYPHHVPVPSLTAMTGADGRFRIDGIGRERIVTLHVEGPGIHYSQMQTMTRRAEGNRGLNNITTENNIQKNMIYGAAFDYLVKPARLIRGTVREKDSGKPLSGIRIRGTGFTDYATAETTTDEQGRYDLPGCPKGDRYSLLAFPIQGAPFFCSSIVLKDTPGLGPLTADLEMVRGIPCEGKVLDDETSQAVPGEIMYCPLNPNTNVPEDLGVGRVTVAPVSMAPVRADGTFRCVVLPGCGCLTFRAKEPTRYQQACVDPRTIKAQGNKRILWIQENAAAGGLIDQEKYQAIRLINPAKDTEKVSEVLYVTAARQIHGTVLDADGRPLVGVRVRGLERGEGWKTLPNEKFTARCVNPLRPRRVYFVHDARRLIGSVEVKGTETNPLTVPMQPWAAVSGRLLDAEGRPLRNARIIGKEFVLQDGRTDDQGRFRLDGLVPGLRYDFFFSKDKPSVSGPLRIGFVAKPGEVRELGDVRGQPPRKE